MKKLHRYVIKSFIGPFIMTFSISVFILLMQFLWKYIDDMAGKGLNMSIVFEMMFYASFTVLPFAFPIAMLIASIMAFGAMGENYELLAMKAAGISLRRIMQPIFFIALAVSMLAFYISNNVISQTNLKFYTLLQSVKEQRPELILQESVFTNDIDGYSIRMGSKNHSTNMLYDLLIYDHTRSRENQSVTVADSGSIRITEDKRYMILTLYSGVNYTEEEGGINNKDSYYPFRRDRFDKQLIRARVKNFEFNRRDEGIFKNVYKMLNINDLKHMEDSLSVIYKKKVDDYIIQQNINPYLSYNIRKVVNPNDTTLNRKLPFEAAKKDTIFNYTQLFKGFDNWVQQEILRNAISNARGNVQNVNMYQEQLYHRKKSLNKYTIERYRKFTLSLAVLVFFFIGAPLGAIIRKGGLGAPVVVSVLLFIAYHVLTMTGEKSAREDVWNMSFGMWFSTMVFLPIGIWLTYKAINDSPLMSSETYTKILSNLNIFKKKKKEDNVTPKSLN